MPTAFEELEQDISLRTINLLRELNDSVLQLPPELTGLVAEYVFFENTLWEEAYALFFPTTAEELHDLNHQRHRQINPNIGDSSNIYWAENGFLSAFKKEETDTPKEVFRKQYFLFLNSILIHPYLHGSELSPALRNDIAFARACRSRVDLFDPMLLSHRAVAMSVLLAKGHNLIGMDTSLQGMDTSVLPYLNPREKNNKKFWYDVMSQNQNTLVFLGYLDKLYSGPLDILNDKAFLLAISPLLLSNVSLPTYLPRLDVFYDKFNNDPLLSQAVGTNYKFLWKVLAAFTLTLTAMAIGILILTSIVTAPIGVGAVLTAMSSVVALGLFKKISSHQKAISSLKQEAQRRFIDNPGCDDTDYSLEENSLII